MIPYAKISFALNRVNRLLLLMIPMILYSCAPETEKEELSEVGKYKPLISEVFDGRLAYETTDYVEDFWRLPGNSGFDSSIYRIKDVLEKNGFRNESEATDSDRLIYRIEKRKMTKPTWEPDDAIVTIEGDDRPLLQFGSNRNMIAINSYSTPGGAVSGRIAEVNNLNQLDKQDLKGKIIYTKLSPAVFGDKASQRGALGILSFNMPSYLQTEKNTTSIQFGSIRLDSVNRPWAINLSYEANERLRKALEKGEVTVGAKIRTRIYPSVELTLIAEVRGSQLPDEQLVFSSHVQEPGANDNASGVGVALEMAVATAGLLKEEKLDLKRTIAFLWGDEITSTRRYVAEKSEGRKIKWGISLDMVGENTEITGGTFLIEKMPDPSAIWTRGNDQHSEWGGSPLSLDEMMPHYLNDFVINRFKERARATGWRVETNPFEGGSDHVPFLKAGVPGVLFWHFTDQFYHTDNDRIDKVSVSTLNNVGNAALDCAFQLANASQGTVLTIIEETKTEGLKRLKEELKQGKYAIDGGETVEKQLSILEAWSNWYVDAIRSVKDVMGSDEVIEGKISEAIRSLKDEASHCKETLRAYRSEK